MVKPWNVCAHLWLFPANEEMVERKDILYLCQMDSSANLNTPLDNKAGYKTHTAQIALFSMSSQDNTIFLIFF